MQSAGRLWASGNLTLTASSLNLDAARVQAANISISAAGGEGSLSTAGSQLLAQGQLSASAASLNNAGGQLSAERLALQLSTLDNRSGSLLHTGTATLNLNVTSLDNRGGV
ncbi:hypothetical protein DBR42_24870, partial [Pelomonas sp. HMWF004]